MANLIVPVVASAGIGLLGRLFAPHKINRQDTPAQRLDNLGAPDSEFGYLIRDFYGINRVNGCSMIYATPLKEVITSESVTQSQGGGGKGGGGTTTVTNTEAANYYMTAVYLIGGEMIDNGINRVWANGVQIYAAGDTGEVSQQFLDHTQLRTGTTTQNPLDVLVALEGSGNVPAFRGCSLLAFNEYPISLFKGSGFPKIDVEAKFRFGLNPKIKDIIWHIAAKVGIAQADIVFLNNCGEIAVAGTMYENSGSSIRDFIEDICRINFLHYWETDGKLYFDYLNTNNFVKAIDLDALGARDYNSEPIIQFEKPLIDPIELPTTVGVNFVNRNKDYDRGYQFYKDQSATHVREENFNTSIVGNDGDMGRVASRLLFQSKAYKHKLEKLYLMPCYQGIKVGDCIAINQGGVNRLWRVERKTIGTNYLIELYCAGANGSVTYDQQDPNTPIIIDPIYPDPGIPADPGPGDDGYYPPTSPPTVGTATLIPLDIPLISDSHSDSSFYLAVEGDANWVGGTVYLSRDSGASYQAIATASGKSVIGLVATATASNATVIRVSNCTGQLSSVTQAQFDLNNGILFKLGNEIIMARDATLISPGVYDLSVFKRGCRGTEWAIAGHGINEQFILLSGYIARVNLQASDIGLPLRFKAVGTGATEPSVTAYASITPAGISLECYSPVNASAIKSQGGNITISWDRRDRHDGWSATSNLMSEATESYEIEVFNGPTVVRTLTSTSRQVSYSAADQVTDFGSVQSSLTVKIYQLSARVGRGYALSVTLTPTLSALTPVITAFSPTQGGINGSITIYGENFTGATGCNIGGVAITSFTVVDDTRITGFIGTGTTTGKVSVTTPSGTGESLTDFVIITGGVDWGDIGGTLSSQTDLQNALDSKMAIADYDSDEDGVVDSAEKIEGIDGAGNSKYYGTNGLGVAGFYSLPTGGGSQKYKNIESISATKTLALSDPYFQFLTPTVSSVIVKLPFVTGSDYFEGEIINAGNGVNSLVIQENNGTSIVTLSVSGDGVRSIYYYWDGSIWRVFERSYY